MTPVETFPAVWVALYAAHVIGDHWIQTDSEALGKDGPGWRARLLCARHVLSLAATKLVTLLVTVAVLHVHLSALAVVAGLAVDAVTHYIADRRAPLRALARLVGKQPFWKLGDDVAAPAGTGAYALDQAWHVAWLWVAALIIAVL